MTKIHKFDSFYFARVLNIFGTRCFFLFCFLHCFLGKRDEVDRIKIKHALLRPTPLDFPLFYIASVRKTNLLGGGRAAHCIIIIIIILKFLIILTKSSLR